MIQQGRIAQAQGKAQEKINEYNARQAEMEGKSRLQSARLEADRFARKASFVNAANRAKAAKSGISISDSPTTLDVLADTAYQLHLDTNIISQGGMNDYIRMQNQQSLLRAEGAFAKEQGNIAQKWGYISGGTQLAVAGATAYGGYKFATLKPTTQTGSPSATGSGQYGGTSGGGPTGGGSRSMIG
jgi:hypothetical protein